MSSEKSGDGTVKWTAGAAILSALIAASAVLTVGYWQYAQKNDGVKDFRGRIVDSKTGKVIRQAKITLEAQGAPSIIYSDSEGFFSFPLEKAGTQVRVRVEVNSYEKYDKLTNPSSGTGVEEIQIQPIQTAPIPSISSTLAPQTHLDYSLMEGKRLVVERFKLEQGGWEIIWEYEAKVSNRILTMRGRKTRINGQSPSEGETMAISTYKMTLENLNAEGELEETNYRNEVLHGLVKIIFAKNLKSFNGNVYQGNQEIANITGSKQ